MPVPLVIRMVYYVRIPRSSVLPLSRRTVMARDQYACQYCGATPVRAELTLDHIVPRSRGGATDWENVVVACRACNQKKGSRTPREAQMTLLREPHRPRYVALALLGEPMHREVWSKYLF